MIRFAWLQARTQNLVMAVGLAAVAVVTLATGPHLGHLYAFTVAECAARGGCVGGVNPFSNNDYALYGALGMVVLVLPAVAGMFLGAPLVARELETGTYRLAWTQSVGRQQWLRTKLAVAGLAAVATTGLLTLAVSWSARSIDLSKANQFRYFDQRGIVPLGYVAFAFTLGVVIGLLIRKVLPAVAVTLVAFVATRFAVERWLRTHLVAATHHVFGLNQARLGFTVLPSSGVTFQADPPDLQNAYVLSAQVVDKAGHPVSAGALHRFVAQYCPTIAQGPMASAPAGSGHAVHAPAAQGAFSACLGHLSTVYRQSVAYIAPDKYWTLQWLETAVFLGAALALVGAALWLVNRSPS